MRLRNVLRGLVAIVVLATTGCPNPGIPENTVSFTLDGVDYVYSASTGVSTHAWGQGNESHSQYHITASASQADAAAGMNTIDIDIYSEGGYWIEASVRDALDHVYWFDLGSGDRTLIENTFRNLDEIGEQMRAVFWGPYEYVNSSTHTLENLVISVERLEDMIAAQ